MLTPYHRQRHRQTWYIHCNNGHGTTIDPDCATDLSPHSMNTTMDPNGATIPSSHNNSGSIPTCSAMWRQQYIQFEVWRDLALLWINVHYRSQRRCDIATVTRTSYETPRPQIDHQTIYCDLHRRRRSSGTWYGTCDLCPICQVSGVIGLQTSWAAQGHDAQCDVRTNTWSDSERRAPQHLARSRCINGNSGGDPRSESSMFLQWDLTDSGHRLVLIGDQFNCDNAKVCA